MLCWRVKAWREFSFAKIQKREHTRERATHARHLHPTRRLFICGRAKKPLPILAHRPAPYVCCRHRQFVQMPLCINYPVCRLQKAERREGYNFQFSISLRWCWKRTASVALSLFFLLPLVCAGARVPGAAVGHASVCSLSYPLAPGPSYSLPLAPIAHALLSGRKRICCVDYVRVYRATAGVSSSPRKKVRGAASEVFGIFAASSAPFVSFELARFPM